jgi:hypothetical protein
MVLAAFALRLAYILLFHTYIFPAGGARNPLAPPLDHYAFGYETGAIAKSLALGQGFSAPFGGNTGPTAWIAPLYPALSAAVFKIFGVFSNQSAFVLLALNSLFSALTCIPMCEIGRRALGRIPGLAAAWVFAVVFLFMRWAATWIWEVSLSGLLLTVIFLQALKLARVVAPDQSDTSYSSDGSDKPNRAPTGNRRLAGRWAAFGLLWGGSALVNPALLTFLPFCLAWLIWRGRRRPSREDGAAARSAGQSDFRLLAGRLLLFACVFLAVIAPWLARNHRVFGRWVFIRSNAGFEFSLSNFHGSNGLGWPGRHPSGNLREFNEYVRLGEIDYVHRRGQEAAAFIRRRPGEFVSLTARRFWAFWYGTYINYADPKLEPFPTWTYWPLSLLTLLGLITILARREPGAGLFAAAIFAYPLPYYFTLAAPRYRHPLEPLMLLVSMYFVVGAARDVRASTARRGRSGTKDSEGVLQAGDAVDSD